MAVTERGGHSAAVTARGGHSAWARAQQLRLLGAVAQQQVGSSQTQDQPGVPCTGRRFSTTGPPGKSCSLPTFELHTWVPDIDVYYQSSQCQRSGRSSTHPRHPARRWHVPHPKHHPQAAPHDGRVRGSPHPARHGQDPPWCSPRAVTFGKRFLIFPWHGRDYFLIVELQ